MTYKTTKSDRECQRRHRLKHRDWWKQYWSSRKEKDKAYNKEYYQKNKDREFRKMRQPAHRYSQSKYLAKQRNIVWRITFEQFVRLIQKPCVYCNRVTSSTGSGLDRINNRKGYTIRNVYPCCTDCNSIRGNKLTVNEMHVAMKAILKYRRQIK